MERIVLFLDGLKLTRKQTFRNMTVFPLVAADGGEPDYLTLEKALNTGLVRITEVGSEGGVPELKVINSSRRCVLIIEGEELVGARRNRIVNSSFLLPGKAEVIIPVSCVEQGRWVYRSREFRAGDRIMHASLRRASQHEVKASLERGRGYHSNQGRIWEDIEEKASRLQAPSETGAMADMFEHAGDRLADYGKAFRTVECQVGAVLAINGRILGLETFRHYSTFSEFFNKLIKGYALDAVDWKDEYAPTKVQPERVRRFLGSISRSNGVEHDGPGIGKNIRFEARTISGSALVHDGRVLHMSAFRNEKRQDKKGLGYQRFSGRRRFMNL